MRDEALAEILSRMYIWFGANRCHVGKRAFWAHDYGLLTVGDPGRDY